MSSTRPGSVDLADLTRQERELRLLVLGGTLHVHNLMTRLSLDPDIPGTTSRQPGRRGLRRLAWWLAPSQAVLEGSLARGAKSRLLTNMSVPGPPQDDL